MIVEALQSLENPDHVARLDRMGSPEHREVIHLLMNSGNVEEISHIFYQINLILQFLIRFYTFYMFVKFTGPGAPGMRHFSLYFH